MRVTYRHSFTADDDLLKLEARAGEQLTIDGFNNNAIRVLDVTDPYAVQEVYGYLSKEESGFSISLVVPGKGRRSLLATTNDRAPSVAGLVRDNASNLRGARPGADLLIITRRELFDSVQELREFRNNQGLSVALVDIEDIYDEFSFGQKSPHAVKDFIGFALTVWKTPVKYVLFFGDASLDPKNHLGFGDFDMVRYSHDRYDVYANGERRVVGDFNSDGIADFAVGRLPAATPVKHTTGHQEDHSL